MEVEKLGLRLILDSGKGFWKSHFTDVKHSELSRKMLPNQSGGRVSRYGRLEL
uniref:Uncharacterized protein n=1 Tax=Setaria digitata TaxID=48799 RepID=A0A915PDE2_9BILA